MEIYVDNRNDIHPTAMIESDAVIGEGNTIGPYVIIRGCVVIGDNNYIGPLTVIGEPAEYKNPPQGSAPGRVMIGNNNRISEHVAIQNAILTGATIIGDDCYIMHGCHFGHDAKIGDGSVIAPLCSIGGMAILEDEVTLGQGVIIHPRRVIGRAAMIGMNSTVTKDIPALEVWAGTPAKYLRMNHKKIQDGN